MPIEHLRPDGLILHLALLEYLEDANRPVPISELAQHFGCSEHDIREAVLVIAETGLPSPDGVLMPGEQFSIDWDALADGVVDVTDFLRVNSPLALTDTERAVLLAGLDVLASVPGAVSGDAARRLSARLAAPHPADAPSETEGTAPTAAQAATGRSAPRAATEPPSISATHSRPTVDLEARISAAIDGGRRIRFHYRSETSGDRERTVDPARLIVVQHEPFLRAWCLDRQAERTFRVDRIRDLEVLEVPVAPRPVPASDRIFTPKRSAMRATVRVQPAAMAAVREFLPPNPRIPPAKRDGTREVDLAMWSWLPLCRLVAQHAGEIEVLAPAEARAAVAEFAGRALGALSRTE